MRRFLSLAVIAAALIIPSVGAAADTPLDVNLISETSTTITLGWTPPAEANSYKFFANGVQVANSQNGTKSQVKFSKATCNTSPDCYVVVWSKEGGRGGYPHNVACNNKKDDDADGKIDYPADPGCTSLTDNDETDAPPPPPNPACSDGLDNDNDTKIDYPNDPGCTSATDTDETDPTGQTTITASQFNSMAVSGATISNVHVTGDVAITHTNVTVTNSTFDGEIGFEPGASGSKLLTSSAREFYIAGADNILLDGNFFDGKKVTQYNHIWDDPAGNTPSNWIIRNNTFQHFWVQADPSNHSEALFIGYSDHGLIENNYFFDNGTTSHIFFSWFGSLASSTHWPNNICVRGNTTGDTGNVSIDHHYYAVNFRSEIKTSANIVIQPDLSSTSPEFYGIC